MTISLENFLSVPVKWIKHLTYQGIACERLSFERVYISSSEGRAEYFAGAKSIFADNKARLYSSLTMRANLGSFLEKSFKNWSVTDSASTAFSSPSWVRRILITRRSLGWGLRWT